MKLGAGGQFHGKGLASQAWKPGNYVSQVWHVPVMTELEEAETRGSLGLPSQLILLDW